MADSDVGERVAECSSRGRCRSLLSLWLRRGQIGAVVMTYDGTAFEVEFADRDGRAYALLPISAEKLLALRDSPEPALT